MAASSLLLPSSCFHSQSSVHCFVRRNSCVSRSGQNGTSKFPLILSSRASSIPFHSERVAIQSTRVGEGEDSIWKRVNSPAADSSLDLSDFRFCVRAGQFLGSAVGLKFCSSWLSHEPTNTHGSMNSTFPPASSTLAAASAALFVFASVFVAYPAACWAAIEDYSDVQESAAGRYLSPRTQEQINESFANKNGADLSFQDLAGATFMEASLRGTDLHGSDLRGAMFTKAILYKANLEDADLSDALIDKAVLNEANLRNALLRGAWLALTDLGDADITRADFSEAIIHKFQLKQLCARAEGVNKRTGVSTRESLRCDTTRFYSGSGK
eukprot:TRINITY_DN646_c0_g1_i2.p1 TRINITY_DN646_c0_g1~~TRINITY_DN646_c0_g1_i2.p1  ORF type:complete len:326 (+),score=51.56 TRINITY_DN646_c0_g1_i2:73-1050(+)